jgi:hypothetical protein
MNERHLRVIAEAATDWALARKEVLAKETIQPGDLNALSIAETRLYQLTGVK